MELIKKDSVILSDGHKYRGWGYYQNGEFIPHGCGKNFTMVNTHMATSRMAY